MTHQRINRSATFVIAACIFLAFKIPSAHAAHFVIPPQLKLEGLAFSPSTTFDKPINIPTNTATVEFVKPKAMKINKPHHKTEELAKIVVTPTEPTETLLENTSTSQQIIPTPTIYIAPAITRVTPPLPSPTPKITAKLYTPTPEITTVTPTTPPVTVTQAALAGGLNADKLFGMVNAYRQSKGLAPFEKDDRVCSLASSRAPEINGEVASGTMHSGLRARALPYWNTENIISMNSEEGAFNWWINDTIHREAIESGNKYSCVACSGNACAEEFTSFQPK